VDTVVLQSAWNVDKLDGTGPSGVTIDPTKAQIFWLDMEWLGVGSVRMGVVVDGQFFLCHIWHHANNENGVYISTPNLPCRYEIYNDGTGAAAELEAICATVISEGGQDANGRLLHVAADKVDANVVGTTYGLLGIRLKSTALDESLELVSSTVMVTTADDFRWSLVFNPTVAGTPSWTSVDAASSTEWAQGSTATTITGGLTTDGGWVKAGAQGGSDAFGLRNAIRLGSLIDGTPDEIWLCATPLAINADVYASLTWRENS